MKQPTLHKFWWLWTPLIVAAVQAGLEVFLPSSILSPMHTEDGPHEFLQFLVVLCGFFVATSTLRRMDIKAQRWLAAWVGLAATCCFYVAGEEISWGQHLLEWSTPEYWATVNDQDETNLHNTSSWLDQKPRLILLIGAVTGGVLIPILQRFKPAWVPERFTIIYPPATLGLTAAMALGVNLIGKIDDMVPFIIMERGSEVEELYLFYFVLLYLIVLRRRIV